MKPHPASLLLAWLAMAFSLQWLPLSWLLGLTPFILIPGLWQAKHRFLSMLRRARWLLLSILVLFALATPGEPLPGPPSLLGITLEGCRLALSHTLRLTLLLALLALLLEHMGIPELISGLHTLLSPMGNHPQRSRLALRLMLVLEYVEKARQSSHGVTRKNWQDWLTPQAALEDNQETPIELPLTPLTLADKLLMALALLTAFALGLGSPPA